MYLWIQIAPPKYSSTKCHLVLFGNPPIKYTWISVFSSLLQFLSIFAETIIIPPYFSQKCIMWFFLRNSQTSSSLRKGLEQALHDNLPYQGFARKKMQKKTRRCTSTAGRHHHHHHHHSAIIIQPSSSSSSSSSSCHPLLKFH